MFVGLLSLTLFIPESNSLKGKRQVISSIKIKLRKKFNISVIETPEDKWQITQITIGYLNSKKSEIHREISNIINFIKGFNDIELVDYQEEII